MGRKVDTGVLIGAFIPFLGEPLNKTDDAVSVLGLSVRGAVLQHYFPDVRMDPNLRRLLLKLHKTLDVVIETLDPQLKTDVMKKIDAIKGAYPIPGLGAPPPPGYEVVCHAAWRFCVHPRRRPGDGRLSDRGFGGTRRVRRQGHCRARRRHAQPDWRDR